MSYAKYIDLDIHIHNILDIHIHDIHDIPTIDKTFELLLGEDAFKICIASRKDAEQFIFRNKNIAIVRYTSQTSIKHCATENKRSDIVEKMDGVLKVVTSEIEDEKETDFETARRILMEFRHDNLLPMVTISFYSSVSTVYQGRSVPPGVRHVQIFSCDEFHKTIESVKKLGPTILYGHDTPLIEIQQIPGNNFNLHKIPEASIKECLVPGSYHKEK